MKKYFTFELARKNMFAWLAVLLLVVSAATRIVFYSLHVEETAGVEANWFAIVFLILPLLSCAWFSYDLIVHGETRIYKTAKPMVLWALLSIVGLCILCEDICTKLMIGVCVYIALGVVYSITVNAGSIHGRSLSIAAALAAIAFTVFYALFARIANGITMEEVSSLSFLLAVLAVLIGMKKVCSDKPFPMRGDRHDGRRIRSLDPISGVAVYIMPDRNGSTNLFKDCFECSNAEKYIRQKREEGMESFGYTHLLLAAYVRTVSQKPAMNRFISGQKIYSRGDDLEVCMAIKKEMSTEGSETIIKCHFSPDDTARDVYEKFNAEVEKVKNTSELDSNFDNVAGLLNLIPGVLMKFTVWVLKCFDYFGKLPKFLTDVSPFHGSLFVTSMGSLGIPPIYHHLYDFGNIPIFVAFGMKRRVNELQSDGTVIQRKYIDFTVTSDERICDGFYYASAFKYLRRCLADPYRLDNKPDEIVRDVF